MQDRVSFTSDAVTRVRPDGVEETIRWDDLDEVVILSTADGPWQDDIFFFLVGADGKSGCVIPQSAEGSQQLLERLQQLPGFDNRAVVEAMASTSEATFPCWKRPAG